MLTKKNNNFALNKKKSYFNSKIFGKLLIKLLVDKKNKRITKHQFIMRTKRCANSAPFSF
jgi:hypothetical protein